MFWNVGNCWILFKLASCMDGNEKCQCVVVQFVWVIVKKVKHIWGRSLGFLPLKSPKYPLAFPILPSIKHGSPTLMLYWYFLTFKFIKLISSKQVGFFFPIKFSVSFPFRSRTNKMLCFSPFHKHVFLFHKILFQNVLLNHRKLLSQAQRSRLIMCLLRVGDKKQFHVDDSSQLKKKLFCYICTPYKFNFISRFTVCNA